MVKQLKSTVSPVDAMSLCDERKRHVGRPAMLAECDRRDRILDAACCVLQKFGYHAASMDKVAAESGMSKRTLYLMFPSKRDLFRSLIDKRLFSIEVGQCLQGEPPNPERELTLLLHELAKVLLRPDLISLLRTIIAEGASSSDIPEIVASLKMGGEDNEIKIWLLRQQEKGLFKGGDIDRLQHMVFGMTIGDLILHTLFFVPPDPQDVERHVEEGVRIFVAGLRALN